MAERTCTGDCLKCSFQQQTYCAAQRSYGIMKNQEAIVAKLDAIISSLPKFTSNEIISLLNKDSAQKEAGAENRASETIKNLE